MYRVEIVKSDIIRIKLGNHQVVTNTKWIANFEYSLYSDVQEWFDINIKNYYVVNKFNIDFSGKMTQPCLKSFGYNSSSEYILDISRDYSIYVCSSRAIPSVIDGLKDGQRKALWLIRNKQDKIKTISLAGEMISSNLYVHGDSSAAMSISMLAAPYLNNIPLLQGIGTFGTRVAPTEVAAPRYTYVKKNKVTQALLYSDLDLVPLKENYDGSVMEPVHFLPIIPTVLLNGISGIAVGWSTEILPRNPKDLVDAVIKVLEGKQIKKLKPHYSYLTVDVVNIEDNSWEFTGKATVTDSTTISVSELPPDLNLEKFKIKLDKLEELGQINSYIDRSTETIDIKVKLPRNKIKGWSDGKCIDFLKLRSKKTERIVVIDWNNKNIKQYANAEDLIKDFVEWRLGWYVKRYEQYLKETKNELLYWKTLEVCFNKNLPKKLNTLKNRQEMEDLITQIAIKLQPTKDIIEKITNLPTYRWTQEYYNTVLEKIKELEENINLYNIVLGSEELIKKIYIDECMSLKKLI